MPSKRARLHEVPKRPRAAEQLPNLTADQCGDVHLLASGRMTLGLARSRPRAEIQPAHALQVEPECCTVSVSTAVRSRHRTGSSRPVGEASMREVQATEQSVQLVEPREQRIV